MGNPTNQSLKNPLIELMEGVGSNRAIYMYIGKVLPKWIDNWLDTSFGTGLQKVSGIVFKGIEGVKDTVGLFLI